MREGSGFKWSITRERDINTDKTDDRGLETTVQPTGSSPRAAYKIEINFLILRDTKKT